MQRFIFTAFILLISCSDRPQIHIQGETMGTTYNVKIVTETEVDQAKLRARIYSVLLEVNRQMSTWQDDSEISQFNNFKDTSAYSISADFYNVVKMSQELAELTEGAFDITIKPLVSAWGFKREGRPKHKLSQGTLDSLLAFTGYRKIELLPDNHIRKTDPRVTIDLGGIAKGFGVDKVKLVLDSAGFTNYFIEIGGEDIAKGNNAKGEAWRVGISLPRPEANPNDLQKVLALSDKAIATSGDYRNFYWLDGEFVSHRLDPKTGRPVQSSLASASVITDNCAYADGLALAFLIIGKDKALEIANRLDHVDAYFIERESDSSFVEYFSNNFEAQYIK